MCAKALDMAMILDYWGRELVLLSRAVISPKQGLASLISLLMAVTNLQPPGQPGTKTKVGMGMVGFP
ncbi:hypothetical protein MUG91_G1n288 [Manis pentadactyla]|nr:hypothetical protein MUG91_G1n288 [Manis pentadactyla]